MFPIRFQFDGVAPSPVPAANDKATNSKKDNGSETGKKDSVKGTKEAVSRHFYDLAPSGTYGSMSYLVRACCVVIDAVPKEGDFDCHVS